MLFHFSQLLHPNHFILVDLMHNLVHLYAARKILTRPEKERKIQLCTMVLETLVKIDPGFTKWRGTLLQVLKFGYAPNGCIIQRTFFTYTILK